MQPNWSNQIITIYLIGQFKPVKWYDIISLSEIISYHITSLVSFLFTALSHCYPHIICKKNIYSGPKTFLGVIATLRCNGEKSFHWPFEAEFLTKPWKSLGPFSIRNTISKKSAKFACLKAYRPLCHWKVWDTLALFGVWEKNSNKFIFLTILHYFEFPSMVSLNLHKRSATGIVVKVLFGNS